MFPQRIDNTYRGHPLEIWGLSQLVFSLLGVLALTRYCAMIPFLFALFGLSTSRGGGFCW